MRKKGDTTTVPDAAVAVVAAAGISKKKKPAAARPSRAAEAPGAAGVLAPLDPRRADRTASPAAASDHAMAGNECLVSNPASRETSTTPVESDLLRYLSAHIAPHAAAAGGGATSAADMHAAGPLRGSITSFEIGRDEYLQGVLRLVKADCPEVMHDMPCFVAAMQTAFAHVHNESRGREA